MGTMEIFRIGGLINDRIPDGFSNNLGDDSVCLLLQFLKMTSGNLVSPEADDSFLLVAFFDAGAASAFIFSFHCL